MEEQVALQREAEGKEGAKTSGRGRDPLERGSLALRRWEVDSSLSLFSGPNIPALYILGQFQSSTIFYVVIVM